jgi:hypothetical protein
METMEQASDEYYKRTFWARENLNYRGTFFVSYVSFAHINSVSYYLYNNV